MAPAQEHHLTVGRTARYHTLGELSSATREVWFVLHGHAQLSAYFIRHFAALDDGTRLIVAPEGLNRFYLEQTHWKGAGQARVGATWMTREDREHEIVDYVSYLDALHDSVFARLARAAMRVTVLGFSQGVSTACRWLCRGHARADTLVLWAGPVPPELDAAAIGRVRAALICHGARDEFYTTETFAGDVQRLRDARVSVVPLEFAGGHEWSEDVVQAASRFLHERLP